VVYLKNHQTPKVQCNQHQKHLNPQQKKLTLKRYLQIKSELVNQEREKMIKNSQLKQKEAVVEKK
jgi:hypothetical protein